METAVRLAIVLLIALGAMMLLAYAFQRTLIYYPAHAPLEALKPRAKQAGLLEWRDAEERFIGWRTQHGQGLPVLILHGNAGYALHRSDIVARLRDAGISSPVYILEYPGYGARPGTPTERHLISAATEAIDLLGQRAILLGESLGSGVACQAAVRRSDKVAGLVLVTPFDSLVAVAAKHYPLVPASLILKDRYQSSQALQKFAGPIAVIMAEGDTIIPADSTQRLFDSYTGPKKLFRVPRSEHNEVFGDLANSDLLAALTFAGDR